MQHPITFIDAFTDTTFQGNPAAVMILDHWLSDDVMQAIATENNLSETAFVVKTETSYHIRWFSPLTEIEFCGHATLASAFVLFQKDSARHELIFYAEAVGQLTVKKTDTGRIEMSFPNRKPEYLSAEDIPDALLQGLSIQPKEVHRSQQAYFAVYHHAQDVIDVQQSPNELKKLAPYDVTVTAAAQDYDFISRYFWPANGGDEDPVTGSIHAGLAPLWAEKLSKLTLSAYQASERGGKLYCEVQGERVVISGTAVQYLEGYITIPDAS